MERRYLMATIAMAATFALFSHAFGSGLLTKARDPQTTLISEMRCAAETLRARMLDKVNRSLGAGSAEEAQIRVEMNLPSSALVAVPAPPAAPAAPVLAAKTTAVRRAMACPSQRLIAVRLPQDYERAQARAMAAQSKAFTEQQKIQAKALALQEKMEAKALAQQARMMAVQVRLSSQAMQREVTRTAMAQARANIAQAKINSHPCPGQRTVHVSSRSADEDMDINVDLDQLSNQIEEQVSRSVNSSIRNF